MESGQASQPIGKAGDLNRAPAAFWLAHALISSMGVSVTKACAKHGLSRGMYYYWKEKEGVEPDTSNALDCPSAIDEDKSKPEPEDRTSARAS